MNQINVTLINEIITQQRLNIDQIEYLNETTQNLHQHTTKTQQDLHDSHAIITKQLKTQQTQIKQLENRIQQLENKDR